MTSRHSFNAQAKQRKHYFPNIIVSVGRYPGYGRRRFGKACVAWLRSRWWIGRSGESCGRKNGSAPRAFRRVWPTRRKFPPVFTGQRGKIDFKVRKHDLLGAKIKMDGTDIRKVTFLSLGWRVNLFLSFQLEGFHLVSKNYFRILMF